MLLVSLCLMTGCQSLSKRAGQPPPASALPSEPIELAPDAARRAEAIAAYATGIAIQLTQGIEPAIAYYRRAVELDPGNTDQGLNLAKLYLSRKEPAQASALLERLTAANPRLAEPWFWLGVAYKSQDRHAEGLTALQRAHKLDPEDLNPVQALLEVYIQQADLVEATKLLDRSFRARATEAGYWTRLGDLSAAALKQVPGLAARLDPNRPLACYEKALAITPDDPEIIGRVAPLYEAADRTDEAAQLYQRLSTLRPSDVALHVKLAEHYLATDQKEKAADELEQVLKIDPLGLVQVYNELAEIYEELEQDERAITTYQQSLAVNPNQPEPYLRIALIHMRHRRIDLAQQMINEARDKFPAAYQVPYFQGLLHNEKKEFGAAVAAFAEAEDLAARASQTAALDATFYFYYGSARERAGQLDKAVALFRKSIELNPNQHAAYNYLGYMWAEKGIHLDEALELIKTAVSRDPDNGAYLDSLGWVLYQLGRTSEALPHLQRAAELVGKDPVVHQHLAEVLLKLERRQEAIEHFEIALESDPNNAALREKLNKLKAESSSAGTTSSKAP